MTRKLALKALGVWFVVFMLTSNGVSLLIEVFLGLEPGLDGGLEFFALLITFLVGFLTARDAEKIYLMKRLPRE